MRKNREWGPLQQRANEIECEPVSAYLVFSTVGPLDPSAQCAHNSEESIGMAATLGLLKPPILSGKPLQCYSKLKIPSNPTKLNVSVDSTTDPQILLPHSIHALKSASLPLTALAIPFFLDPNASSASLVLAYSLLDLEFLTFLGSM
jgi:hypothetical protein